MAGCTRRSRRKQISKWERGSAFRASSAVEEGVVIFVYVPVANSMYLWRNYHVLSTTIYLWD